MRHASPASWYAQQRPRVTHCSALWLLPLLLLLLPHVRTEAAEPCLVRATLYMTPPEQRRDQDFGLPLTIDCAGDGNTTRTGAFDLGPQRVAGKPHVRLNGSETPAVGVASYGMEYLANCAQLQSIELTRFVADASLQLSCGHNNLPLQQLSAVALRHNELATLSGGSFALAPHLRQLLLEDNSLRLLETFAGCAELQQLVVRRERQLALRLPQTLAPLRQLRQLELSQLKLVTADFLADLPGELSSLLVQRTPIEPRALQLSNGSDHLVNLSLVQCELSGLTLLQSPAASSLLQLNLSGNALRQLELASGSLRSLDLSGNHLRSLNGSWFEQLPQLRTLRLQGNQLHRIAWQQLLQLAPGTLLQLDLRDNELVRLEETQHADWDRAQQLRIQIDGNPWSCQWLLNFSHAQPQLFRLFQYAKYISQINVNGLSCRPQPEQRSEQPPAASSNRSQQSALNKWTDAERKAHLNVSSHTVLYGNPIQQSHSQRAEALIIVFMLPLGIALLFLLLYLYLHCERLFHWSYYAGGLPCFGASKAARSHRFVDHIDVVRFPIASEPLEPPADGYETPLSGSASICNCTGHRQSTCSRTHHVTYETMPTELPYQLYTEIKELTDADEAHQGLDATIAATAPIYDHLAFDEEKPLEV